MALGAMESWSGLSKETEGEGTLTPFLLGDRARDSWRGAGRACAGRHGPQQPPPPAPHSAPHAGRLRLLPPSPRRSPGECSCGALTSPEGTVADSGQHSSLTKTIGVKVAVSHR